MMDKMLSLLTALVLVGSALGIVSCGASRTPAGVQPAIVQEGKLPLDVAPDRLIIMYDEAVGKEPLRKAIEAYGAEIIYDYSIIPGMAIRIPEGKEISEAMTYFKQVKGVTSVERDHIYHLPEPVRPKVEVM
jgi:hypothetical protein